jgi:shikimate 5-dehydrogenase
MYVKSEIPTLYFIGVTTSNSSIFKVLPVWANYLKLGKCEIKGIDLKIHDDPAKYRETVEFIKNDELSLGAVVTSHKLDLFKASKDLFNELGGYAAMLSEISCISKRNRKLCGHAFDPVTCGLALEAFLPEDHWKKTGAEVFILGAGGSAIAISLYLMKKEHGNNHPSKIYISNRGKDRLIAMKDIHARLNVTVPVEYINVTSPEMNDSCVNGLNPGSLIINATGLGKDAPGSPITWEAEFPMNGLVWDFNSRGDLIFLDQARKQQRERNLIIEDGWTYFLYGWTRAISEIFHIDIPTSGKVFDQLSEIAAEIRKKA